MENQLILKENTEKAVKFRRENLPILKSMNRSSANALKIKYAGLLPKPARIKQASIKAALMSDRYNLPWEIDMYHSFQEDSLKYGFRWMRYTYDGKTLIIYNLKFPFAKRSIQCKNVAKRYIRWFEWMKNGRTIKKPQNRSTTV